MQLDSICLWEDEVAREPALNMALDEVMLLRSSAPWLRIYRWARPAVSIGFSQPAAVVPEAQRDWSVVRRWTGGGVVLHDHDWTYTLVIPASHPLGSVRTSETYRWIHESLVAALADCGITDCILQAEATSDGMGVCFAEPARHDVLREGAKIAGAAQRRARSGLLHQGSARLPWNPPGLGAQLAQRLAREVRCISQTEAEVELLAAAETLAAEKYAQPCWLLERRARPGVAA